MKPIEVSSNIDDKLSANFISTPHQKTVLNELDNLGQDTEYSAKRLDSKIPTTKEKKIQSQIRN